MYKAIIDLGTNTFHLLIAEVNGKDVVEKQKLQIPVKLGQGGINKGIITDDAYKRGMSALREFKALIDTYRINEIKAFATSAIRSANNGEQFVNEAMENYCIPIQTIGGNEEACFIYHGVSHSFSLPDENILVMDIGGGSVEFIIGHQDTILWKQSFELGAARLMDLFHRHDPILNEEVEHLSAYLGQQLKPVKEAAAHFSATTMVGAAGSFETLADVVLKDMFIEPLWLSENAVEITRKEFNSFYERMVFSTAEQRRKLRGMVDFRVEMITVAAILMKHVMDECGIKRMITSDYSLKEGILFTVD